VKKEKIDETGLYSFATREQEDNEKIVIGGMTLTKRGERLLIISFTLLLLTAMVVVGTIE
jgi:hypothetical protein